MGKIKQVQKEKKIKKKIKEDKEKQKRIKLFSEEYLWKISCDKSFR